MVSFVPEKLSDNLAELPRNFKSVPQSTLLFIDIEQKTAMLSLQLSLTQR